MKFRMAVKVMLNFIFGLLIFIMAYFCIVFFIFSRGSIPEVYAWIWKLIFVSGVIYLIVKQLKRNKSFAFGIIFGLSFFFGIYLLSKNLELRGRLVDTFSDDVNLQLTDVPNITAEKPLIVTVLPLKIQDRFKKKGEALLRSKLALNITEIRYKGVPVSKAMYLEIITMLKEAVYKEAYIYQPTVYEAMHNVGDYTKNTVLEKSIATPAYVEPVKAKPPYDKNCLMIEMVWVKHESYGVVSDVEKLYIAPNSFSFSAAERPTWDFEFFYTSTKVWEIFSNLKKIL